MPEVAGFTEGPLLIGTSVSGASGQGLWLGGSINNDREAMLAVPGDCRGLIW